jgi:hypothetical protein
VPCHRAQPENGLTHTLTPIVILTKEGSPRRSECHEATLPDASVNVYLTRLVGGDLVAQVVCIPEGSGLTTIESARCSICARSKFSCSRIQNPGVLPTVFDKRTAISLESPERPFSKLESAGRETLSIWAASVTVSPRSSMAPRTILPGCTGLFIGMTLLPF